MIVIVQLTNRYCTVEWWQLWWKWQSLIVEIVSGIMGMVRFSLG